MALQGMANVLDVVTWRGFCEGVCVLWRLLREVLAMVLLVTYAERC